MPPPAAVVDASVWYSRHVRNALTWHALEGIFAFHWSAEILAEVRRSLIKRNIEKHGEPRENRVDAVIGRVTSALSQLQPQAEVPASAVIANLGKATNHREDRHVLAAAIATNAQFVVTENLRHFKREDCMPHEVEALSPDQFLVRMLSNETLDAALIALHSQAAVHGWTLEEALAILRERLPSYVAELARRLGPEDPGS